MKRVATFSNLALKHSCSIECYLIKLNIILHLFVNGMSFLHTMYALAPPTLAPERTRALRMRLY